LTKIRFVIYFTPFFTILLMPFFGSLRLSTSKIFFYESKKSIIRSHPSTPGFFIVFVSYVKKLWGWTICICIGTLRRPLKLEFYQSILLLHAIVNTYEAECTLYNFLCCENKLQNSQKAKMSWIIKLLLSRINFYKHTSFDLHNFFKNYIIDYNLTK